MVDLLIGLLVFCIVAGVILFIVQIALNKIVSWNILTADVAAIVMKIAYAFCAIAVLVVYIAPLLKLLLSGRIS